MAVKPTYLRVGFLDKAGRIAEVRYRMKEEFNDDGTNITDVTDAVSDMLVELNVLTWDHIEYAYLEMNLVGASAGPNISANNQVYAFLRAVGDNDDQPYGVQVPAWDDFTFDQDENGIIIGPVFALAASTFVDNILDVETGEPLIYQWAQSRGRKLRKKQLG